MTVYVPTYYESDSTAPSWTGNYNYPIVAIRGVFSSKEEAKKSIRGWRYENQYFEMEVFEFDERCEKDSSLTTFFLDFDGWEMSILPDKYGKYALDEIVNEEYSAYYDEYERLGNEDF